MSKRIALFSDGTGNSSAKAQKTNVWRLFQALDQTEANQLAKYDDGVGTSSNRFLAAIGGAFGWGLKRNVIDLYKFVCRNYELGDDIYGFGFSRGAFTIRVLVDFIATEGLVTFRSEEELDRNARAAYRQYRSRQFPSWSPFVIVMRWLRDAILWMKDRIKDYPTYATLKQRMTAANRANVPIRFLGLWDTVEAYGMPIAALKRGIDWVLWPMLFGDLILSPRVQRACHALSLDDERATFHPLLWDEVAEAGMVAKRQVPPGRITQVWFAGVHSNVGGGYPEDQLSLVPLGWMMRQATDNGLVLKPQAVDQVLAARSPYARLYDSRAGLASYYGYSPRQILVRSDQDGLKILPIIHGSVVMRMAYGSDAYAPITLPYEFWVLAPDGELLPMEGAPLSLKLDATKVRVASAPPLPQMTTAISAAKAQLLEAIQRLARPDREIVRFVWDTVFWRQCVYVLTVTLTTLLALYPWLAFLQPTKGDEIAQGPISSVVKAAGGLIPSYATHWVNALEKYPLEMAAIALAVIFCVIGGNILNERIHDRSLSAWRKDYLQRLTNLLNEGQYGTRNILVLAAIVALCVLILAYISGRKETTILELFILSGGLIAILIIQALGRRVSVSHSEGTAMRGTLALSVARFIRNNRLLIVLYDIVLGRAVPILFAFLLLGAGWAIINRTLFDAVTATGQFCGETTATDKQYIDSIGSIGSSSRDFQTDNICWPSGLILKKGHRYRITLETPGNWFDREIRVGVDGFPAGNFVRTIATPLKRRWAEAWFKPIARISSVGNDEYVLTATDWVEPHPYPACPDVQRDLIGGAIGGKISPDAAKNLMDCAPTPEDRRSLITELTARKDGELFLYVNDAVLMLPGLTDIFYTNNSGTGKVKVEQIHQLPQP